MQSIEKIVEFPCFAKVKKEYLMNALWYCSLSQCFFYVVCKKGWNIKDEGEEMYFISEINQWVPSIYFDLKTDFCPN